MCVTVHVQDILHFFFQFSWWGILQPKAKGRQFPSLITHMQVYKCQRWLWLACDLTLWCNGVKLFFYYAGQVLTIFFVTAEWTNFILHFQILLILPSALMETTAMALHSVESYLAGLWHSLLKSVLGSSLPLEARAAQSSQNREVRSLCKVSIPDGGLPQLFFWCWQPIAHNFYLTQLHLITDINCRNVQHIRTTKGNIMESNTCTLDE